MQCELLWVWGRQRGGSRASKMLETRALQGGMSGVQGVGVGTSSRRSLRWAGSLEGEVGRGKHPGSPQGVAVSGSAAELPAVPTGGARRRVLSQSTRCLGSACPGSCPPPTSVERSPAGLPGGACCLCQEAALIFMGNESFL